MNPSCIAEFFFDQSSAHGAHAKDTLNASEMNVRPGGSQRRMHATTIPHDNPNPQLYGQPQEMVFLTDLPLDHKYYEFCGQPKGMRAVFEERGLWINCVLKTVARHSWVTVRIANEPEGSRRTCSKCCCSGSVR